eukprot:COSAG05_NODE_2731_length_2718_cov_1.743795_2_plen_74_part_00
MRASCMIIITYLKVQSTVAQQNTGETREIVHVLSRRATALLRRMMITCRLQSALEINLNIHAMRAITLSEQLV